MREIKIIRILIGLNLIIFLLPFFNACSNTPLRKESKEILNEIKSNSKYSKEFKEELIKNEKDRFSDRKKINDETVQNAYQLGVMPFQDVDEKMFKEPYFYFALCFTYFIVSNFFLLFYIWKEKIKKGKFVVLANIVLLLASLLIPFFGGILEHLDQIKIGYYVYLLNLIILYLLFKKVARKQKYSSQLQGQFSWFHFRKE